MIVSTATGASAGPCADQVETFTGTTVSLLPDPSAGAPTGHWELRAEAPNRIRMVG
jgi:hypothetical protein